MDWRSIALVTAGYVVCGAALVVVLWPTERVGTRFLRRWGITAPSREQSLVAAGYLRTRRLLSLALFVVTPPVAAAVARLAGQPGQATGFLRLLIPLIAALLLAEVAAALRPARGARSAVLARRSWRGLVPAWAIALLLGLAALALVLSAAGLAAQPWAHRVAAALPPNGVAQSANDYTVYISDSHRAEITQPLGVLVITGTVLCLAAVLGLVRLAVRRRTVADPLVDAVLRARTARVVVGLGIGWLAHMVLLAGNRLGFLDNAPSGPVRLPAPPGWLADVAAFTRFLGPALLLVVAAGWIWVATAPRHPRHLQPGT